MMFSRKKKYYVWFLKNVSETYRFLGKKRIKPTTTEVKSSRNQMHKIDTSLSIEFKNKFVIFVDVDETMQVLITPTGSFKNGEKQLTPEMLNFYVGDKTIKQVISGIIGKMEINWMQLILAVGFGIGLGWIIREILLMV